jgi:hypothetical protein
MSLVELAAIAKQQSFGGHMVIASLVLYTRDMLLGFIRIYEIYLHVESMS